MRCNEDEIINDKYEIRVEGFNCRHDCEYAIKCHPSPYSFHSHVEEEKSICDEMILLYSILFCMFTRPIGITQFVLLLLNSSQVESNSGRATNPPGALY